MRSFGTEDRQADCVVPPRDDLYEYIIFRGSDIEDLTVCEPPKPQQPPTPLLPPDPAIVQVYRPMYFCIYSDNMNLGKLDSAYVMFASKSSVYW